VAVKLVFTGNGWIRGLNGGVNLDSAPHPGNWEVTTQLYSVGQKAKGKKETGVNVHRTVRTSVARILIVASSGIPRFECVLQ
jgi:hypothetical protein